jgi:hypothetical protein
VRRDDFGRGVDLDLSTTQLEITREYFPLSIVFDGAAVDAWAYQYVQLDPQSASERLKRWSTFKSEVLGNITGYTVPVIVLKKETPRAAVCTVFEKVNTGGVTLDVFDLLTATFAATKFDLRQDWEDRRRRLDQHKVLRGLQSTDFLQAITLLATRERRLSWDETQSAKRPAVSCKRTDILRLTRDEYERWAPAVEKGFLWAAAFLTGEMIYESRDVPYRTQLVPLAAIHVALGASAEVIGRVEKIRRWFWCGVLGELYGGAIETRFANDVQQVTDWCGGADVEPITVYESSFDPGRLLTLRTRNSAAYKGIYALLMKGGSKDWLYDQDITIASHHALAVDIHHIFPKKWCIAAKIDDLRRESIVNKTAISAVTNRKIGGQAPSKYVPKLRTEAETDEQELRRRVELHHIDYDALVSDDFDAHFDARRKCLLDLIGSAMGKVLADVASARPPEDYELDDEDPTDDDVLEVEDPERPKRFTFRELRERHPASHVRWSPEEESQLVSNFHGGQTLEQMAATHGRTRLAIHVRLAKLGLMEPPGGLGAPSNGTG